MTFSCVWICIYLIDVCYLRPHVVLFDRLLFGFPAWERQHHLRGMGHPEERRNSSVTHTDRLNIMLTDNMDVDSVMVTVVKGSGCTM